MSSTSAQFNLLAVVAILAAIFQLPTRIHELVEAAGDALLVVPLGAAVLFFVLLTCWSRPPPAFNLFADHLASWTVSGLLVAIDWLRAVGTFPDFVDRLLRNEEQRAKISRDHAKMRSSYNKQQHTIDSLSQGIGAACSEYNKLRSDYSDVFPYRVRPRFTLAKTYRDKKWSEPYLIVKMCKFFFLFCQPPQHPSSIVCHLPVTTIDSSAKYPPLLPISPSVFHLTAAFVCS